MVLLGLSLATGQVSRWKVPAQLLDVLWCPVMFFLLACETTYYNHYLHTRFTEYLRYVVETCWNHPMSFTKPQELLYQAWNGPAQVYQNCLKVTSPILSMLSMLWVIQTPGICVQTRPWQVGTPFSHQPAQQCYLPGGFKPSRMVWFDGRFQQQMSNWENMGYSCNRFKLRQLNRDFIWRNGFVVHRTWVFTLKVEDPHKWFHRVDDYQTWGLAVTMWNALQDVMGDICSIMKWYFWGSNMSYLKT